MGLLLVFIANAPPAFAATNNHTRVVSSTVLTTSVNSFGNPCATRQSDETLVDGFGNVQIWLRMKTTYCWNYRIVSVTVLKWPFRTFDDQRTYLLSPILGLPKAEKHKREMPPLSELE